MSSPPHFLPRPKSACLAALLTLAALLAAAPSGATAAEGPQALWQRCDGGAEDLSCLIPRGIGVNPTNGHLYISDQDNSRIVELTAWGELIRAWGWGVSDGSEELQVCTSAAVCQAGIPGGGRGQLTVPQGIAIDSGGNVYVAEGDFNNRRVQKFDPEGHFIVMFGGKVNKTKVEEGKPEAEQNRCPVDPGDVCQAATEGNGNGQFGPWVAGSFIAAGPSPANLLYVGDKERVQVFNPNGTYKENFPDPEGIISAGGSVQSLAAAPSGGLYLAFKEKASVTRLTSAGKVSVSPGCVAKVAKPTAIAMAQTASGAPTGNLYVFDDATKEAHQFSAACAEKEGTFAKGEIAGSTGIAAGVACLTSGADVYLSNSVFTNSYVLTYGSAPNKPACPKPGLAPEIVAQFAVSVGTTEAELRAQVNPRFQADTEYFVQYGTVACLEGGFEAECVEELPVPPAALGAPAADFPFTTAGVFLTGLEPATAYRYRFVAQSSGGGPAFGEERGFSTATLPGHVGCPNDVLRGGASAALPDCRAYEMVSPVDKEGGDIITEEDFNHRKAKRDQSAESGNRFTYSAYRAFGDAETAPFVSQYLAERTPGGWSSHDISPPRGVGIANETVASALVFYSEYQAFSPDLCSAWLTTATGTAPPLAPDAEPFNFSVYRRTNCGAGANSYRTLSKVHLGVTFAPLQGLSADEGVAVFRNKAHLSQDVAIPANSPGEANRLGCLSPAPQKPLARQWLRDGTPIPGATAVAYTVDKAEDAGHTIQCRLTATGGGSGSTQVANPTWVIAPYPAVAPPEAPAHIAPPSTSGALTVGGAGGQTLGCDPGAWEGSPTFAYKWYRNGAPIAGAEAPEYTVQAADLAAPATFQCEAIATNAGGTVTETSDVLATDPAPKAPVARPYMAFNGAAEVAYAGRLGAKPRAVCVLPGGVQSDSCSVGSATLVALSDGRGDQVDGAVSADGSRVFWTNAGRGQGRIYMRLNPTAAQSALASGEATGSGKRTSGSATMEEVTTTSGAFAAGQSVSGEGIPFGTTIEAVGAGTLTLSANATKSTAASATLAATSECTEADKACTIGISEIVEEGASKSRFWAARPDGGEVLFATGPGGELNQDLYLLDVDTGTPTLIAHQTLGVVGTSKDLSRIYFVSTEALTGGEENSEGGVAEAGKPNLYLRRSGGALSFVAALSGADERYVETQERLSPGNVQPYLHGARTSADGESVAFVSTANPTGYDNTDVASGQADAEVYLYRAQSGELSCASCAPSGARPVGRDLGNSSEPFWMAAKLPNIENELYAQRLLSEDGGRLFFESFGPLAGADTNGKQDVYQWEAAGSGTCTTKSPSFSPQNEGCVDLISSGESPQDSELLDATPSGSDVFIRTGSSLVPQDPGLFDVYDARVEGGFPPPSPPQAPCEGEACQSPPAPPAEVTPASAAFSGAGNEAGKPRCGKGKHRVVRKGKARCAKKERHHRRTHSNHGRAAR